MNLVELPNGVGTSYTYDDGDRLTDIEHMLGINALDGLRTPSPCKNNEHPRSTQAVNRWRTTVKTEEF